MVATGNDFETNDCKTLISRILATEEFDKIEQRVDDISSTDRELKIKGVELLSIEFSCSIGHVALFHLLSYTPNLCFYPDHI